METADMTNLFAHTEQHNDYPAFVSINRDNAGNYSITVRSAGNGGRDMGSINISPEILKNMAVNVLAAIDGETLISGVDREAFCTAMVSRFLGWKLPEDFAPDAGISFDSEYGKRWGMPTGTNLLHAEQAKAMFMHCLKGE